MAQPYRVFGAEFGLLWLTSENALADTEGTRILTLNEFWELEEWWNEDADR